MVRFPIEKAFTKCPFCGIIYPLVPPAGERRHDDTDDVFRGCNAPMPNPRNPDDPNGCFTCFSCNITEGFDSTGKKIKRCFSAEQRKNGGLARCESCVSARRMCQFPAFEQECCDNSVGAELRKAVGRVDVHAVSSLLSAGADPDYARQAYIADTYAVQHFRSITDTRSELLWNQNGSIVHDSYNDGLLPTRPLPYVMFRLANYDAGAEYQNGLNAIARMLIDAGASLSPSVQLVGRFHGYRFENFNPSHWIDMPAVITLWRAQNAIRQVLEQCQKHDHFDFGKYFQERNKCTEFTLTEKAVRASSELRPFYYAYTERRAIARLQSHRSSLLSGRQQNGEFLPALPTKIEARIRSLALLSAENPILATQIPDPIAHDSV